MRRPGSAVRSMNQASSVPSDGAQSTVTTTVRLTVLRTSSAVRLRNSRGCRVDQPVWKAWTIRKTSGVTTATATSTASATRTGGPGAVVARAGGGDGGGGAAASRRWCQRLCPCAMCVAGSPVALLARGRAAPSARASVGPPPCRDDRPHRARGGARERPCSCQRGLGWARARRRGHRSWACLEQLDGRGTGAELADGDRVGLELVERGLGLCRRHARGDRVLEARAVGDDLLPLGRGEEGDEAAAPRPGSATSAGRRRRRRRRRSRRRGARSRRSPSACSTRRPRPAGGTSSTG